MDKYPEIISPFEPEIISVTVYGLTSIKINVYLSEENINIEVYILVFYGIRN